MGAKVNALEAAAIVGKNERTIRAWIASGRLRAEPSGPRGKSEHAGPTAWSIDTDDLAALAPVNAGELARVEAEHGQRGPGSVLSRLDALEREVRALRAMLRLQNTPSSTTADTGSAAYASRTRYGDNLSVSSLSDQPDYPTSVESPLSASYARSTSHTVTLAHHSDGRETFTTKASAAKWLQNHSDAPYSTIKGWPEWEGVPLTREAALALAMRQAAKPKTRIRLHRCGDSTCPCAEMLAE